MNPVFYMLSFALFFWSISAGLSNHLAKPAKRKPAKQITSLQKTVSANPKDEKANMELAFSLVQSGFENGDMQLVMQAVQSFRNVLDINPKNQQALLGLASLCLQSGVLDKANTYYQRYLEVKPNDLNAKADYAMVKFKLKQIAQGEKILSEIIKADNKLFSPYAVGTIAYNTILSEGASQDNKEQYRKRFKFYFEKAKQTAPSKDAISNLESTFAKNAPVDSTQTTKIVKTKEIAGKTTKKTVENYFTTHHIIGPKLVGYTWKEQTINLELKDFPVDKMPDFAKAKFISGVKTVIANSDFQVKLLDAGTKLELMAIE